VATRIVVAARDPDHVDRLFLVDPEHTTRQLAEATSRELLTELTLQSSPAEPLEVNGSDEVRWLRQHALVGLCALQVGVCTEAVRLVSNYVSERRQFGRPLGSFQGVALRTADAYIDAEAIRVTMCQAAWRLASGLDAEREIYAAKWWAAEAGHRVVHAVQHLHGGIGADVEYPAHRYFLWGKHLATTLGGSSQQLALLGQRLAEDVRRGRPAFA
jgi:acyl-CoA dehydrogenase